MGKGNEPFTLKALEIYERRVRDDSEELAPVRKNLKAIYGELGEHEKALEIYKYTHHNNTYIARLKVISGLLISDSKAELQEARMKVHQDSLRLGNIGVIRAGTVISEAWEDGQVLKDLNAHLFGVTFPSIHVQS